MAYMIPDTIPRSATAGERILFSTFKKFLPEDYVVYYEPSIDGKHPDFLIISPDLGLLILEVKDYTNKTLYELTPEKWRLYTSSGSLETVVNPIQQARSYVFKIVNKLKRDRTLLQTESGRTSSLKFPYGYGVVFTRLSELDVVKNELFRVIEPNLILSRSDIDPDSESFDASNLIEKLMGMFNVRFGSGSYLSHDDINTIRYHIFPEIRISKEPKYSEDGLLQLTTLKAMDLYQELLAKNIGEGHRLLRGVAGSGKTLILAARARIIAEKHPDWKVLILTYGVALSRDIESLLSGMMERTFEGEESKEKVGQNVQVCAFHEWLHSSLKIYSDEGIDYYLQRLEYGDETPPTYDAILIDEGQDFESSWLTLVSKCLNPETSTFLYVEDRAQDIFKRKSSISKDTGLDFRGRSRILNINYRNSEHILSLAWKFYQNFHSSFKSKVKEEPTELLDIIPPKGTKRKSETPVFCRLDTLHKEAFYIALSIEKLHKQHNIPYSEILILYRIQKWGSENYVEKLQECLKAKNIPFTWVTKNQQTKKNFSRHDNTVKIFTIDSAKGLNYKAVFVFKVDSMPFVKEEDLDREVSLMYIAMTRSTDWLVITASGESKFTEYFQSLQVKPTETSFRSMNLFERKN